MLVYFKSPNKKSFMVSENVLVDGKLHHLRNAADAFVLQSRRPTNFNELRAPIPASWDDSNGVFFLSMGRVVWRWLLVKAII